MSIEYCLVHLLERFPKVSLVDIAVHSPFICDMRYDVYILRYDVCNNGHPVASQKDFKSSSY